MGLEGVDGIFLTLLKRLLEFFHDLSLEEEGLIREGTRPGSLSLLGNTTINTLNASEDEGWK